MKLIFKVWCVDFFPTHYHTTYIRVVCAFFTVHTTDPTILQRFSTINNRWCLARSQFAYIWYVLSRNRLGRVVIYFRYGRRDWKGKKKNHKHINRSGEQCSQIVQLRDEKSPLNIILCTHPTKRFCTAFKRETRERRNRVNIGDNLIIASQITRNFVQVHFCHKLFASRDFRREL